jgi:hypothetical protein
MSPDEYITLAGCEGYLYYFDVDVLVLPTHIIQIASPSLSRLRPLRLLSALYNGRLSRPVSRPLSRAAGW